MTHSRKKFLHIEHVGILASDWPCCKLISRICALISKIAQSSPQRWTWILVDLLDIPEPILHYSGVQSLDHPEGPLSERGAVKISVHRKAEFASEALRSALEKLHCVLSTWKEKKSMIESSRNFLSTF